MAKEAAVLRSIGSRHPKEIAQYEAISGSHQWFGHRAHGDGGKATVLAVNVEYAVVHTEAFHVAVNIQCAIARRCVARSTLWRNHHGGTIDWDYR
jgi:tartrate dehydratase alpha subunit/fumarate hydratase class I-like protein